MDIRNRIAVITGASSGIGRATALALARQGGRVALGARNPTTLEQVAAEVHQAGGEALVVSTDVTQREQVERLVQTAIGRWGKVDILVANSGQYIRGATIAQMELGALEDSMAVNFYGSVYPIMAVLPDMQAHHSGHIVLVTSFDAKKGLPLDAPYVAAKFAASGFAEVLRQELHGSGIDVTTVFPGRVDTPMIDHIQVPWISAKIKPEAVASAIVKAIRRRQAEVIVPPQIKALLYLNVLSPRLGDWAARVFHLEGWESKSNHSN